MELPCSFEELQKPLPLMAGRPITELLLQLRQLMAACEDDTQRSSLIGHVARLFHNADPDWLFSLVSANQAEAGWAELRGAYGGVVAALIGCAAVPPCEDDCGSLTSARYRAVPVLATPTCSALRALLTALANWEGEGGAREALLMAVAPQVCVFAVTHFQDQAWTSPSSREAAQSLQVALLKAGRWRDSAHLLMGEQRLGEGPEREGRGQVKNKGILGEVLDILQPQMTRDSWQRYEPLKLVFSWTLLQLSGPALSLHLPRLLPPSLLLNDHHRPDNCMLGVRCLHHIVLNTPASDLQQFNRADVLYQALFRHLYTTEAAVIQLALSCLLDLLLVLEKPPSTLTSSRRKGCRHDNVLRLMLSHMEAEHKVPLRRVYAAALPLYLDRVGVGVARHLRRLEPVLLGYLEVRDPPEESSRLNILEALQRTIRAAWPRFRSRQGVLLRALLRLLVDVSSDSQLSAAPRQRLMGGASCCLQLLDGCSHGNLQRLLPHADSSCCNEDVLCCLATVTTTTER